MHYFFSFSYCFLDLFNTSTEIVGEDARFFYFRNQLYIVYNTHNRNEQKRLYYAPLYYMPDIASQNNMFLLLDQIIHVIVGKHERQHISNHQKNWSPFEYHFNNNNNSTLLFSYTLQPHVIVQTYPFIATTNKLISNRTFLNNSFHKIEIAETVFSSRIHHHHNWQWGEMRG